MTNNTPGRVNHIRRPLVVLGNGTNVQQSPPQNQGVLPFSKNKSPLVIASSCSEESSTLAPSTLSTPSSNNHKVFRYAQWRDLEGSLKITDKALLFRPHPCTSPRSRCHSTIRRLYWGHLQSHQVKTLLKKGGGGASSKYLLRLNVVRPHTASTLVLRLSSAEELQALDQEIEQRLKTRRRKEEEDSNSDNSGASTEVSVSSFQEEEEEEEDNHDGSEDSTDVSVSSIQCLMPSASSVSSVGMESPSVASEDTEDSGEVSVEEVRVETINLHSSAISFTSSLATEEMQLPSTKKHSNRSPLTVLLVVLLAAFMVVVPLVHSTQLLLFMPRTTTTSPAGGPLGLMDKPYARDTTSRPNKNKSVIPWDQTSTNSGPAAPLALVPQQKSPSTSPLQYWSNQFRTLAVLIQPSKTCLGILATTMEDWIDSCRTTSSSNQNQSRLPPQESPKSKQRASNPLLHFGMGAV